MTPCLKTSGKMPDNRMQLQRSVKNCIFSAIKSFKNRVGIMSTGDSEVRKSSNTSSRFIGKILANSDYTTRSFEVQSRLLLNLGSSSTMSFTFFVKKMLNLFARSKVDEFTGSVSFL